MHEVVRALPLALDSAGNNIAASMAMIAMTTSNFNQRKGVPPSLGESCRYHPITESCPEAGPRAVLGSQRPRMQGRVQNRFHPACQVGHAASRGRLAVRRQCQAAPRRSAVRLRTAEALHPKPDSLSFFNGFSTRFQFPVPSILRINQPVEHTAIGPAKRRDTWLVT